jgi:hypothetical protein
MARGITLHQRLEPTLRRRGILCYTTWTTRQDCTARFQWPGYNYDNPGINTYTLSLRQPTDPGESEPLLVYLQETRWNAPCADNHPIGTERTRKILNACKSVGFQRCPQPASGVPLR